MGDQQFDRDKFYEALATCRLAEVIFEPDAFIKSVIEYRRLLIKYKKWRMKPTATLIENLEVMIDEQIKKYEKINSALGVELPKLFN